MMNNEIQNNDELDDFKSLWQSQTEEKSYDSSQIFKMIHKKSVNSVQWLFILSIIELLLGILISAWSYFSGNHFYSEETLNSVGRESLDKIESISHLGLIGSFIFMAIVFFYYRKISSNLSVKGLMDNIIKFRKTVIWFLASWLTLGTVVLSPIYYQMGKTAYLNSLREETLSLEEIQSTANGAGWGFTIVIVLFILIVCGLYYLIIYGFFLRRLNKNLKELKNIEA